MQTPPIKTNHQRVKKDTQTTKKRWATPAIEKIELNTSVFTRLMKAGEPFGS
ncbi:hypothetical protein [Emticicia sp. TH156]|uniref:hypothetical protein n=1 Tax=Emticicia sp. TH156 TaxID=2067454 RepID=UPI00130429AA|nr:hypothetical protein [Emticicia sp. TH156]